VPVSLPNTTVADTYPAPGSGGAQIAGTDILDHGYFVVANNSVICQYSYGTEGQSNPSPEFFLATGVYPLSGTDVNPINGLRFKNAVAGKAAQVFGAFFYKNDPTLIAASPFDSQISSSGTVTPPVSSGAYISGELSQATILAGTGFTASRPGTGQYTVTFNTPFAATPDILIQIIDAGNGQWHAPILLAVAANSFTVQFKNNVGTATDASWFFLAQTMQ